MASDDKKVNIKQPIKKTPIVESLTLPDFMKHFAECLSRGKDRGKSMGILHGCIKTVDFVNNCSMSVEFKDGKKINVTATE